LLVALVALTPETNMVVEVEVLAAIELQRELLELTLAPFQD
jgi:hypothetical protein